jgi:ligand-binding sensor domain-containing protein
VGPNAYKLTTETKVSKKVKEAPATVPPTSHTRPLSMAPQVVPIEIKGTKFGSVVKRPFGEGFSGRKFMAAVNDDDNETWFLTDVGIVSGIFGAVPKNSKIPSEVLMDFKYELSIDGPRFWIATPQGAVVASLPIDAYSDAIAYNTGNTTILSDSIFSIAIGKNNLRWFGTSKGISALYNKKWLSPLSQKQYPESRFKDYPITAMATSTNGDSLYVGTKGGGVLRVFRDNVDGISGASDYAQWGPIEMPSDRVYSLCITKDGTQWIGTDMGVARHIGYNTLDNWTVFTKEQGLIDNFIQAIAVDAEGKLWFGTKGGVSVFDGSTWTSYTMNDGMISNNILCILVDKLGIIYLGTDNGLMTYNNETGQLVCFQ